MIHLNLQTNLKLAHAIIKGLRKNPHISIMFVAIGLLLILLANFRGSSYGPISEQKALSISVTKVYNSVSRPIFPNYRAQGVLLGTSMMVEVDIYKKKYESLKMGDRLLVYETFGKPNSYLYAGVVESARPIFKLDNFWFTFEAIIGLIIILFCPYIYYDSYKFRKKNL